MAMSEKDYMYEQANIQRDLQSQGEIEKQKSFAPDIKDKMSEVQAQVIAQTNPARAIAAIVASFRGKMIDEYGDEIQVGEPLMNEYGVARISSYLIPVVNDATRFGNISYKEVRDLTLQIINDITEDIGFNWRNYGIKNSSSKDLIIDSCTAIILITLTRSEEQGEKNWLSKIILESVSANKTPEKRRGGSIWDRLKL